MSVEPKRPDAADPAAKPCPICGKLTSADTAPFCSKRCSEVDLHRWLGGVYVVREDGRDQSTSLSETEG